MRFLQPSTPDFSYFFFIFGIFCIFENPGNLHNSGNFVGLGAWTFFSKNSIRFKISVIEIFFVCLDKISAILVAKKYFEQSSWKSKILVLKCVGGLSLYEWQMLPTQMSSHLHASIWQFAIFDKYLSMWESIFLRQFLTFAQWKSSSYFNWLELHLARPIFCSKFSL